MKVGGMQGCAIGPLPSSGRRLRPARDGYGCHLEAAPSDRVDLFTVFVAHPTKTVKNAQTARRFEIRRQKGERSSRAFHLLNRQSRVAQRMPIRSMARQKAGGPHLFKRSIDRNRPEKKTFHRLHTAHTPERGAGGVDLYPRACLQSQSGRAAGPAAYQAASGATATPSAAARRDTARSLSGRPRVATRPLDNIRTGPDGRLQPAREIAIDCSDISSREAA